MAVRICTLSDCFSHPLRSCNDNWRSTETLYEGNTVPQDMKAWSEKCDRMYVWDYVTNFNHYFTPMPNFQVLQDNIRFFLENNVVGLFEQGNGEDLSGEFGELRYYILSKLMWEPDGDVNRWMRLKKVVGELLFEQVENADYVLLNKIDLADADTIAAVRKDIEGLTKGSVFEISASTDVAGTEQVCAGIVKNIG